MKKCKLENVETGIPHRMKDVKIIPREAQANILVERRRKGQVIPRIFEPLSGRLLNDKLSIENI